jgi:hypothetical protein
MDTETVLRISQESRMGAYHMDDGPTLDAMISFVSAIEEYVRKDEREKCAKVVDNYLSMSNYEFKDTHIGSDGTLETLSAAIRNKS